MDLEAVGDLFDDLLAGSTTVHDICRSEVLIRVIQKLETAKKIHAKLTYSKPVVAVLKMMEIFAEIH